MWSNISNYSLISSTDKWISYTFDSNYYQKAPLIDTYPEFDHICSSRIGFPGDSVVKRWPAKAGDPGLIPGSGRSPGEGNYNPLPIFARRIPLTEEPGGPQSMGLQTDTLSYWHIRQNFLPIALCKTNALFLCVYWKRRKQWRGEDF